MNATDLSRLELLVAEKGWSAYDGLLKSRTDTVEKNLRVFLGAMEPDERELTFQLLEEYLILKEYTRPSLDLLERICDIQREKPIRIAPVKVRDAKRIKSGDALVYEMDAIRGMIDGPNLTFHDDPLDKSFWNNTDFKVVVDDFIGTGDQFLEMLGEISGQGIEPKIDLLATLVMQKTGKERIEKAGHDVTSLEVRTKALEEIVSKHGGSKSEVEAIYLAIEDKTDCSPFDSMGFKGSQATVTMKKTPDNTLPIFWNEGSKKDWPAPFPRKPN